MKKGEQFEWEIKQIFIKNGNNIPRIEAGWEPFAAQSGLFNSSCSSYGYGHTLWIKRKILK